MHRGLRRTLSSAILAGLAGCALVHERPATLDMGPADAAVLRDAGSTPDAAESRDAALAPDVASWDGGPCPRRSVSFAGPCTPELEAICQERAAQQARGRVAYTRCVDHGSQAFCAVGDYCPDDAGRCRCTPTRECAGMAEVCVSDTVDSPRYCHPVCVP